MEHQGSDAALNAFAKFTDILADRELRKRFLQEPEAALKEAGANVEDLPEEVLGFLRALSEEELDLLSRLNREFVAAGLAIRAPSGATVSWL
jgi:hypothetical protein